MDIGWLDDAWATTSAGLTMMGTFNYYQVSQLLPAGSLTASQLEMLLWHPTGLLGEARAS